MYIDTIKQKVIANIKTEKPQKRGHYHFVLQRSTVALKKLDSPKKIIPVCVTKIQNFKM